MTSHYPVCSWVRPACSFLKRLACLSGVSWDGIVPNSIADRCAELQAKLKNEDPVTGIWNPSSAASAGWIAWCDASNVATGVVLEADGDVIEDHCWLRPMSDKRHINVAELDAAIKALNVAVSWKLESVRLVTDSKTVHGWLSMLLGNVQRVKVSGLYKSLVERRLQIIEDLVATTGIKVIVEWVPSAINRADALTRVPATWLKIAKEMEKPSVSAACVQMEGAIPLQAIVEAQQRNNDVLSAIAHLVEPGAEDVVMPGSYRAVQEQLCVKDGVLYRQVKLPLEGLVTVPVIPAELVSSVVQRAHVKSGHANWETMYYLLRGSCYFAGMASECQRHVRQCQRCVAASHRKGPPAPSCRPDIPGKPWSVVQVDSLELGTDATGAFHGVLVCVDSFTKWPEAVPLRRYDARCVADALVSICCRWGPPEMVRVDNGKEFQNAIVQALFDKFGVVVRTGAVRHPQSQGLVERFNRTLLTLLRKMLETSTDWKTDLELMLHFYRMRPHSTTKISPFAAMVGWQPSSQIVEEQPEGQQRTLSQWVDKLTERAAAVRDYLEEILSSSDAAESTGGDDGNPYAVGDAVMLLRPKRHQKLLAPYEPGWMVRNLVSPTTVVIEDASFPERQKVVNVELLKPYTPEEVPRPADAVNLRYDKFKLN